MKQRRWLALLCAVCLLVSACALVGCNGKEPGDASSAEEPQTDFNFDFEEESSTPAKEPVKFPTKTPSGNFEDNVFCVEFTKYDWTETYLIYAQTSNWCNFVPKIGDKVTISFDYCTTGDSEMRFFNTHSLSTSTPVAQKWTDNPDYWFEKLTPQGEKPRKGHFEWTFTATAKDVQDDKGNPRPLRWSWQQIDNDGSSEPQFYDFYYWNFKMTVNGNAKNMINLATYQTSGDLETAVEVDPSQLSPTMNQ